MDLYFNTSLGESYSNASQKIRVLTEAWVLKSIFCPGCGKVVYHYKNNKPVADFYCKECCEDFELKSKKGNFGKKVSAGSYHKMIERIESSQKPNFFFLGYDNSKLCVENFFVVPKHFFIPEIIEKRKPLKETARRAGWVGSNILFSKVPKAGQIFYIENGCQLSKKDVLEKWQKTVFLKDVVKPESKGWLLDIMNCIDSLHKKEFTLDDIYLFENDLAILHPDNKNIKPKIRQQLQFLRDKNYLEFIGDGKYKIN